MAQVTESAILVSVAIVNYNGGPRVVEAAQRVLASNAPLELVVADNGSRDTSLAELRTLTSRFANVRLLELGENRGFASACNAALGESRGEWLLVLNPDCMVEPDTLQGMIATLGRYPDVGMAGCLILGEDGKEQRGCRRDLPRLGSGLATALTLKRGRGGGGEHRRSINRHLQPLPDRPTEVEAISGAFMLIRRTAWREVGPLDEGYFLHCEDLDWCRRFLDHGWKVLFVPAMRVVHYQGTCSAAAPVRVEWHKHRGMLRYYRKHLAAAQPAGMALAVWCGVWARFGLIAMRLALRGLVDKVRL